MVALVSLLNNLFSQTTSWLNNQQRSDLSLPELCEQLLSNRGEVTGLSLASDILGQFEQQTSEEQKAFFTTLTAEFDLVTEYAMALPTEIISFMLGIPEEHRHLLRQYSLNILGALDPVASQNALDAGNTSVSDFGEMLEDIIDHRNKCDKNQ